MKTTAMTAEERVRYMTQAPVRRLILEMSAPTVILCTMLLQTIGMASRELKDSEVEGGAKATVLAKDGIAVIVSNDNPTDNLTVDQIKGIYTGELTTWADVQ